MQGHYPQLLPLGCPGAQASFFRRVLLCPYVLSGWSLAGLQHGEGVAVGIIDSANGTAGVAEQRWCGQAVGHIRLQRLKHLSIVGDAVGCPMVAQPDGGDVATARVPQTSALAVASTVL